MKKKGGTRKKRAVKKKKASPSGGGPAWQWQDSGPSDFKPYRPADSAQLEAAHAALLATGAPLSGANAAVGAAVTTDRDFSGHTGAGVLLGWKIAGVRTGDTSGGLSSDDYCRVNFTKGGAWNVRMDAMSLVAAAAAAASPVVTLRFGSTAYTIDVRAYTQTNGKTSFSRPIRRVDGSGATTHPSGGGSSGSGGGFGGGGFAFGGRGPRGPPRPPTFGASSSPPAPPSGANPFKVGDIVRVKPSVSKPQHGWGSVSPGEEGPVTSVSSSTINVAFPSQSGWGNVWHEMELATPPFAVGDTCRLRAWVLPPADGSWGDVTHDDVGTVSVVDAADPSMVTVDWPRAAGWGARAGAARDVVAYSASEGWKVGDCVALASTAAAGGGAVGLIDSVDASNAATAIEWCDGDATRALPAAAHLRRSAAREADFPEAMWPKFGGSLSACDGMARPLPFHVGDLITLRPEISAPSTGWGRMRAGDVGVCVRVDESSCKVDFPSHDGWNGSTPELMVAVSYVAGAAVRLRAFKHVDDADVTHSDVGTVTAIEGSTLTVDWPRAAGWNGSAAFVVADGSLSAGDVIARSASAAADPLSFGIVLRAPGGGDDARGAIDVQFADAGDVDATTLATESVALADAGALFISFVCFYSFVCFLFFCLLIYSFVCSSILLLADAVRVGFIDANLLHPALWALVGGEDRACDGARRPVEGDRPDEAIANGFPAIADDLTCVAATSRAQKKQRAFVRALFLFGVAIARCAACSHRTVRRTFRTFAYALPHRFSERDPHPPPPPCLLSGTR
jgi:hypothetical protein